MTLGAVGDLGFGGYLLVWLFVALAVLMMLVILVQRGRGGGLSGAFGMGGGGQTAFGVKTGDVFTTVTVVLFALFLILAITLNYKYAAADHELPADAGPAGVPGLPLPGAGAAGGTPASGTPTTPVGPTAPVGTSATTPPPAGAPTSQAK